MSRVDFIGSEYGLDRLISGIQSFSKAIRLLLSRNNLTHQEMVRLSKWANPWGESWLSTSQVSYLRTGKLDKAGPQTMDALGQVNLRLAQAAGDSSKYVIDLPDFGEIPIDFNLPKEPYFLRYPVNHVLQPLEPLDAGGLYMVWLGRLIPEDMDGDGHISDMEARKLSANFSRIIQGWARDRRLTLTDAMSRVLENYDSGDDIRQKTLKSVIAGLEVWSGEQLNQELPALGKLLGDIDGKEQIEVGDVRERLYKLPRD